MKDYTIFYQQLTTPFRSRLQWLKGLVYFNRGMTLFIPLVYSLVLLSAFLTEGWKGLLAFSSCQLSDLVCYRLFANG